jgi:hypothetical protein
MKCLVLALVSLTAAQATDLDELRATQQKLAGARDFNKLPRDEVPLDAFTADSGKENNTVSPRGRCPLPVGPKHRSQSCAKRSRLLH